MYRPLIWVGPSWSSVWSTFLDIPPELTRHNLQPDPAHLDLYSGSTRLNLYPVLTSLDLWHGLVSLNLQPKPTCLDNRLEPTHFDLPRLASLDLRLWPTRLYFRPGSTRLDLQLVSSSLDLRSRPARLNLWPGPVRLKNCRGPARLDFRLSLAWDDSTQFLTQT